MFRVLYVVLLILSVGSGLYFYTQLIFEKVADPVYSTIALLIGCFFTAGIFRETLQTYEHEETHI